MHERDHAARAREVAGVFLRMGATAFGGPAAHIAVMRRELVERRQWIDGTAFLDLVALTALLPGPSSTELAIAIGRRRAGRRGLVASGFCFILPGALIVGVLAWAYDRYGTTWLVEDLRRGLLPAVVAVVVHAAWSLSRAAARPGFAAAVGSAACIAVLAGVNELVVLAAGAAIGVAWAAGAARRASGLAVLPLPVLALAAGEVFFVFLKIGWVLFGSGYVLLALLDAELVDARAVLSAQEVIDAVAVGQVTPGPLFATATFLGYSLAGAPGAIAATVGIFLPSFVLVAVLGRGLDRVLRSSRARPALDGLGAASIGLIVAVIIDLADVAFPDLLAVVIGVAVAVGLFLTRMSSGTLLAIAAGAGLAAGAL